MALSVEAVLAKVILAPSVKKGRGRALPVGLSSSQNVFDDVKTGEAEIVPGDPETTDPSVHAHFDPSYVERLTAEREAALERAKVAEQQLAELREQLDRERNNARELGCREGFEQGCEQALAEQSKEIEAIRTLLRSLSSEQVQLIGMVEDAAVEIGFAATVKLLGQASVDHSLVVAMVKQAMGQVSQREGLVIRLSPADCRRIEQFRARGENSGEWPEIEFRADEKVELGGCVIESRAGSLDARLELQMLELKRLLIVERAQKHAREAD